MTYDASIDLAANILAMIILFGPWVMIPSWLLTRGALGTIARNCGIRHAWLTWIPVAHVWVPGSISDHCHQGRKSKRKLLLALRILQTVLWAAFIYCVIAGIQDAASILEEGSTKSIAKLMVVYAILDGFWYLIPALILGLWGKVLGYVALYDIYAAFALGRRVLYLVLSILPIINVIAKPLCLRDCRDSAEEMQPQEAIVNQ